MAARYCASCGRPLTDEEVQFGVSMCGACAASASEASSTPAEDISLPRQPPGGESTVNLRIDYPERLSRWLLFVKWLFVIPAYIALFLYAIAVSMTTFISFWAILFSGRYLSGGFEFARGYMALQARTYAYFPLLLTDQYPLASRPEKERAVRYDVEEPERLSRWLLLLKLASSLLSVVGTLTTLVAWFLVALVAVPIWFVILFMGRIPRGMFNFVVAVAQWIARVTAWQWLLRDDWSLFGTTTPVRVIVGAGAVAALGLTAFSYAGMPGITNDWLAEITGVDEGEAVVEQFLQAGRASDIEGAIALTVDPRGMRGEVENLIEDNRYLFEGFQNAKTAGWEFSKETGRDDTLELEGELVYESDPKGRFSAVLLKQEGTWKIASLWIERPPP